MKRFRILLSVVCLLSLSACAPAPIMVGRTATPVAPGATEVYMGVGFSHSLTSVDDARCVENDPDDLCLDPRPDYWPKADLVQLMAAWGAAPGTELSATAMPLQVPAIRLGGKTLLYEGAPAFAVDYGTWFSTLNAGLDAGLLASLPVSGGEVYSGLRGFGSVYWSTPASLSAALTLGIITELEGQRGFVEVTFSTGRFTALEPMIGAPPTGIIISPAFGVYF